TRVTAAGEALLEEVSADFDASAACLLQPPATVSTGSASARVQRRPMVQQDGKRCVFMRYLASECIPLRRTYAPWATPGWMAWETGDAPRASAPAWPSK